MKPTTNIFILIAFVLLSISCSSDLEKNIFIPSQATPAYLSGLESNYILSPQNSSQEAFTLQWTSPKLSYHASIINTIEIDLKDSLFKEKITLYSSRTDSSFSITVADLNSKILTLLEKHNIPIQTAEISFRIASSISPAADTIYSNLLNTLITPYSGDPEYPYIALRGVYNNWDFHNSQKLYSKNYNNIYTGMVYFNEKASEGWKLCGSEDWSTDNWSAPDNITTEQSPVTLIPDGQNNIRAYSKNSYFLHFDNSTGVLTLSQPYSSWGIVGDHNNWAGEDIIMTFASEIDAENKYQTYLTATLPLEANARWKIRPDQKWENDISPQAITGEFEDAGDGNFKVSEKGNYTIKWYFNSPTPTLKVIKTE